MDLISRKVVLENLDKRRTYELMDGRNKAYGKGIRDAIKDIEALPSVQAVPLDKLCLLLSDIAGAPCYTQNGEDKCFQLIGDSCNVKWSDKECWKRFLTKWLEEQDDTTGI